MKASSNIVLRYPTLSPVYYAIRALDKKGSGWVNTTIKELARLTKLPSSTIYRHIDGCLAKHMFTKVDKKNTSGRGKIFIAYKASDKLRFTDLENVDFIFPKPMLADRKAFMSRATLAVAIANQNIALAKLTHKINNGRLPFREIVSPDRVKVIQKEIISKDKRLQRLAQRSVSYPVILNHEIENSVYSIGISQRTLGKKMGVTRQTISKRLESANKIRLFKKTSLAESFKDDSVFILADEETGEVQAYKPLPYLYEDKKITHAEYRRLVKKARIARFNFSALQYQTALLLTSTKGLPKTEAGVIEYISRVGLRNFLRNTQRLKGMDYIPETSPTLEAAYSQYDYDNQDLDCYQSEYLVDPEEGIDDDEYY